MTGTNCDLFTHNQSLSYLNHLVVVLLLQTLLRSGDVLFVSYVNSLNVFTRLL